MLQDNIIHGTYYEGPPQAQTILVVPLSDAMPTNGLLLVALIDLENKMTKNPKVTTLSQSLDLFLGVL